MGLALLSLPNEVLIGIIKHADNACKISLLNLRLVSKTLEQLCHDRFLCYLEMLRIDPSQKDNLMRLTEILSSPAHASAVRAVAFDFVRDWRNVWAVTPLVQQLFDKLSTLNVTLELKFSPYGSNEWISEPCIVHYIAGIVKQVLTSHMSVNKLIIRAKEWDPDLQLDKMICRLENLLLAQEKEAQAFSMESLIVEFKHGEVTYNRRDRSLQFTQVTAHDLHAIGHWIQEKRPTELSLTDCQFFVEQLDGILLPVTQPSSSLSRILINNARLMHITSFFGGSQTATPLHKLLSHILQHSNSLRCLHLENIRVETPHPRTLNFVSTNKVHMTSEDNIRKTLTLLMSQLAEEHQFEAESEDIEEDDEEDEDEDDDDDDD
ncbi:hypothetical protein KCU80_g8573, partial [Aureobasidium melanogenum]